MPAGYSGTPLPRKLGIKQGHRIATFGAPDHFPDLLEELPAPVELLADPSSGSGYDVIVLFVPDRDTLERRLPSVIPRLDVDGGLWVSWPKKSSPLASDISEGDVRAAGLAAGLVDNKICAVDEDWSGLRFVHRLEDRPALRR